MGREWPSVRVFYLLETHLGLFAPLTKRAKNYWNKKLRRESPVFRFQLKWRKMAMIRKCQKLRKKPQPSIKGQRMRKGESQGAENERRQGLDPLIISRQLLF